MHKKNDASMIAYAKLFTFQKKMTKNIDSDHFNAHWKCIRMADSVIFSVDSEQLCQVFFYFSLSFFQANTKKACILSDQWWFY